MNPEEIQLVRLRARACVSSSLVWTEGYLPCIVVGLTESPAWYSAHGHGCIGESLGNVKWEASSLCPLLVCIPRHLTEARPLSLSAIIPAGLHVLQESMGKSSGGNVEARVGTGHPDPRERWPSSTS